MIREHLNKQFMLGTAASLRAEIEQVISQKTEGMAIEPNALNSLSIDDLQTIVTVIEYSEAEEAKHSATASDAAATVRDSIAYVPRDEYLSVLQSALDELSESEDLVAQTSGVESEMRGPMAASPFTDRHLKVTSNLALPDDDYRIWGPFEVGHPKLLTSDPRWVTVLLHNARRWIGRKDGTPWPNAPFVTTPAQIELAPNARVILFGDWGSGLSRAQDVAKRIREELADTPAGFAKYVIHLGDVYYSGTEYDYKTRFLAHWPVDSAEDVAASLTLSGNHDMAGDGFPYFDYCLADPRFERQARSSWFRLANDDWQVLGLDSSYEDAGLIGDQSSWVADRLAGFGGKTVLLSHHQLYSPHEAGADTMAEKLLPVIRNASKPVDAWFWGHEHRCIVYEPNELIGYSACIGHGGIPEYLVANDHKDANRDPYESKHGLAGVYKVDHEYQEHYTPLNEPFGMFGFAVMDISGSNAQIRYIDERGETHHQNKVS